MLVKDRMTPNPVTVTPDSSFVAAYQLIREKQIRHLPVVDKKGKLIGIVSQKDLLHASPSSATTLTVFEMNYLLANLQIREVMTSPAIFVAEDMPVEEAARIMVEKDIGCLPVLRGDDLVGVITDADIFKAFVEILGRGAAELRITLRVGDVPGELARLSAVIAGVGGNICSSASFEGSDSDHVYFTIRLKGVRKEVLLQALKDAGEEVVHVYTVPRPEP
jgi:acetoin utilization protein AcuB